MDPARQTKTARVDNGAQTSTAQPSSIPNNATARIDNAPTTRSGIMGAVEVIQVQTPQGTVTSARATVVPTQPGLASGTSAMNQTGEGVTRSTSTLPTGTKNSDIPSTQTLVGTASLGLQSAWHQHAGQHRPHQAHREPTAPEPRAEKPSDRPETKPEQRNTQTSAATEREAVPRPEPKREMLEGRTPENLDKLITLRENQISKEVTTVKEAAPKQEQQTPRDPTVSPTERGPTPQLDTRLTLSALLTPIEQPRIASPEMTRLLVEPPPPTAAPFQERPKSFESPVETVLKAFMHPQAPPSAIDPQRDVTQTINNDLTQIIANQLLQKSQLQRASPAIAALEISEVRGSILDKLTQISEHLKLSTDAPQKSHEQPSSVIQGRETFQRIEPIDRSALPEQSIQRGDRTIPNNPPQPRGVFELSPSPLVDLLERITRNQNLLTTLKRIEVAVDGVLATIATGAILGAIGSYKAVTLMTAAILELMSALKKDHESEDLLPEHKATLTQLIGELNDTLRIQITDDPFALVGDITGRIVNSDTGLPVPGIVVDGGSLGTCLTNEAGCFIFKNVALGTGFILIPSSSEYTCNPKEIVGTTSESSHYVITATRNK